MRLWIYAVRRTLLVVPVIIGVMTITFACVTALPVSQRLADQFGTNPKVNYTPQVPCHNVGVNSSGLCRNPFYFRGIDLLGLNQPVPVQWAVYMYNSLTLHWGYVGNGSGLAGAVPIIKGVPVVTALGWFLPYTLELAALSLIIILAVSIPLGNLSAVNRNRPLDQASRILSFSGFALPAFLLGSFMLFAFVIFLGGTTGRSPFCPGASSYFDLYGSWPAEQCWPGGLFPAWLTAGQISSPTGYPTIDAAIHGDWAIAADTIIRMLIPAFVIAYGTIAFLLRFVEQYAGGPESRLRSDGASEGRARVDGRAQTCREKFSERHHHRPWAHVRRLYRGFSDHRERLRPRRRRADVGVFRLSSAA